MDVVKVIERAREQEPEEQFHPIAHVMADAQTKFKQYQSMRLDTAVESFTTDGKNGKLDLTLAASPCHPPIRRL